MGDHHLVFLEDHIVLAAGIDAALRAFDVAEVFEQYLHHTGEIGFLLEERPRILRMRHVEEHLISRDRKSVRTGKGRYVRVDPGGRRKKKKEKVKVQRDV